jgi:uncharacterized protein (TIGR02996 family)
MQTDAAFLDQLAAHPGDHTTRLVYADWLDEQGGPEASAKAEFLRLTAQSGEQTGPKYAGRVVQERLQQLAARLDTDWLAVVSRLAIENCPREKAKAGNRGRFRFDFLCQRRWEDLQPFADHTVRFCETCLQQVHYCDTIGEARHQAEQGHCVALDLGVIRRPGDLTPPLLLVGRISAEALEEEEERSRPDPVSAERERRKRQRRDERRRTRWEASDE